MKRPFLEKKENWFNLFRSMSPNTWSGIGILHSWICGIKKYDNQNHAFSHTFYTHVSYGSQNKQLLFPWKKSMTTDYFLWDGNLVFRINRKHCVTGQVINSLLLTAESRVRLKFLLCEIWAGLRDNKVGFAPNTSGCLSIYLPPELHTAFYINTILYQKDKRAKYGNSKRMLIWETGNKEQKSTCTFYVLIGVSLGEKWALTDPQTVSALKKTSKQYLPPSYAGH
jgi:hypothetical protein